MSVLQRRPGSAQHSAAEYVEAQAGSRSHPWRTAAAVRGPEEDEQGGTGDLQCQHQVMTPNGSSIAASRGQVACMKACMHTVDGRLPCWCCPGTDLVAR